MNKPKEPKPQFIRFDRGISQYNHDYYAALGLPIISNPMYIRNVYLRIARILHPDVYGFSADEKIIATQYLAKLVNPAYNGLMKDQDRKAYQQIFKLLAKRLMQRSRNIQIHSESACELIMTPSDDVYERLVTELAKVQYQSLTQILDFTAQISELNLVYILCKEGYRHGAANMPPVLAPMVTPKGTKAHTLNFLPPPSKPSYTYSLQYSSEQSSSNLQAKADETVFQFGNDSDNTVLQTRSDSDNTVLQTRSDGDNTVLQTRSDSDNTVLQTRGEHPDIKMINDRIKVCEVYILQSDWKAAIQELRAILRIDENNSKCLALLGVVYINTNQLQMAKASFKRSLYINPQEALALKHLLELSEPDANQSGKSDHKSNSSKKPHLNEKQGWLTNLFTWFSS